MRLLPLTLLLASSAFATTLVAVDVPALTRTADAIVIAEVVTSAPRLTQEGTKIITETQLRISEVLKGTASGTVTVIQPGGIVGDLGQRVEGTAPFKPGEEVLVFLDARGTERFIVTGMIQGKFRIERSSDGKAAYAVPESPSAVRLIDPATHAETITGLKTLALPVIKAQIAAAIATPQPTVVGPTRLKAGQ